MSFETDLSMSVAANGDLDQISGEANLKEAIYRRLFTVKGTLAFRPDYGAGVQRHLNSILNISTQRKIANEIGEELPKDPRIQKVSKVAVYKDSSNVVHIKVSVIPIGGGEISFNFPVGDVPR